MPKKFIRKDKQGRIVEIIPIASLKALNKMFHPAFIKAGQVTEKAVKLGRVFDESTEKYIDYVEPPETSAQRKRRKRRKALADIATFQKEALDIMIEQSNNVKVIALKNKIDIAKGDL